MRLKLAHCPYAAPSGPRRTRVTPELRTEVVARYQRGKTSREVAEACSLAKSTVLTILKLEGVEVRPWAGTIDLLRLRDRAPCVKGNSKRLPSFLTVCKEKVPHLEYKQIYTTHYPNVITSLRKASGINVAISLVAGLSVAILGYGISISQRCEAA